MRGHDGKNELEVRRHLHGLAERIVLVDNVLGDAVRVEFLAYADQFGLEFVALQSLVLAVAIDQALNELVQ